MRHVQQLQLIEKFKNECKAKGYSQPMETMKWHANDQASVTREKRAIIRWIRASDATENNSITSISTVAHHFDEGDSSNLGSNDDDNFEGYFHEPATLPNDYLEAICGNLTLT